MAERAHGVLHSIPAARVQQGQALRMKVREHDRRVQSLEFEGAPDGT